MKSPPQWFPVGAHMICLLLLQFFYSLVSGQNSNYKVLVSNNGPTTIGGTTTFDATVLQGPSSVALAALNRNETVAYTFWWKVEGSPAWIQHLKSPRIWDSFKWHWSKSGRKKVEVHVAILVRTRQDERRYNVRNKTELMVTENIVASLVVTQDSEGNNQTATNKDFEVGRVKLQISVHDPSKLFRLNNISCDWNFGDGTWLNNSLLKKVSHNFTEDIGSYTVTVKLRGWALGREYSGSTSKTLTFKANFDPYLVIRSSQGPKLPPLNPNKTLIATGPVTFEVKFKDPYHLISEVSTDWKFGDGTVVLNWKNGTISHTYYKENMVVLWTTVRVRTKHHKLRTVMWQKHLYFKEPVNFLNVNYTHSHPEKRLVEFNISCNGSVPVSFCWLVRKYCDLHTQSVCSRTVIQNKSCSLLVNQTFPNAGNYCISVGVVNQVSGINTSLTLKITEGPTPTSSPYRKSASDLSVQTVIVSVVVCCLLLALLSLIIKKWIRTKQKRSEKADFEFRDPETTSVSDMTLSFGGGSCFPRCKPENIPLLSRVQNGNHFDHRSIIDIAK